jgi:hypothetical protein
MEHYTEVRKRLLAHAQAKESEQFAKDLLVKALQELS